VRLSARTLAVVGAAATALALARCSFGIDSDQGHFSCVTLADCASGQECVPQADGGNGLCYPAGVCVPETCNGKDDDCDGVVDNHEPCGGGAACVDAGCIDCTACAEPACALASCVVDGGPQRCVSKFLLADGGLGDGGTGPATYVCDFP
jgi:hypothetical protein